jgi:hypothetical protein
MCRQSQGRGSTAGDFLTLIDEDGRGEMRSARYHRFTIGDRRLKFLCFANPDHPDDYRRWLHEGWARGPSVRLTVNSWVQ